LVDWLPGSVEALRAVYFEAPKYCFWIEWNQAACCEAIFDVFCFEGLRMSLGIGLKKIKFVNMVELAPCLAKLLSSKRPFARFRGEKQPTSRGCKGCDELSRHADWYNIFLTAYLIKSRR